MPPSPPPSSSFVLGSGHLRAPDLILIAVYLLAITAFGLRFRRSAGAGPQDRSLQSYFLANNTVPWWAIALSVVSAETSTLTIISIPGIAFAGDLGFLQIVLGYLVGRVVVALLFLPRYFAGEMLTAYQLIGRRFGPTLHRITAGLFLLTRAAAEGVRVFAVSIVVSIAIGTGDVLSIALISALTLLYTFEGGIAAVIWTDVVQMAIYLGGTVIALLTLGHHVPGGWSTILATANAAGKLHTFHFALNLTQSYTFWAGLLGGTFLTMASHGTDQLMVQRLLAARNLRQSQAALLSSGIVIFFQFAFFLLIGAGLWVFYGAALGPQAAASFRSNDYIFPTFIVREMPTGVAGLLVAAILAAAMSNLSAALNSLSSTTVVDFYMRARPDATDRERTLISKSSTGLWAVVLFAVAVYSVHVGGHGHVVEIGLSIAAVAYGSLLGVFLLGTLTRFATETGAILGMIAGFALNLWLWQGTFPAHLGPLTIPHIAFTWYVLIGAAATFALGALASLVLRTTSPKRMPKTLTTAALLAVLLSGAKDLCSSPAEAQTPTSQSQIPAQPRTDPRTPNPANIAPTSEQKQVSLPAADFSQVSQLLNDAIAHHQIPGAVVVIGHSGQVAFQHAYGDRKLAGEPGLDGQPSPAEPMTEDTVFDMASLTKVIVTSTAIGILYDEGRVDFDAPVEKYLPAFNPQHDPQRARVTLRLLLTHFSGEPPDVDLKDPWGLAKPDKAEGLRRALSAPLAGTPGEKFVYSDINFILLGDIIETVTGWDLDQYARFEIFQPLGMTKTRYQPFDHACGAFQPLGSAILWRSNVIDTTVTGSSTGSHIIEDYRCKPQAWIPQAVIPRTAPTAHDDEGTAQTNPNFNHLLRGTVHDPTTRRMGGVAGHAGVFSTAQDMSLFAQALLDRLAGRPSEFPVKRRTLELVTSPEQPGHTPLQVGAAWRVTNAALAQRENPGAPSSPAQPVRVGPQDGYPHPMSPDPLLDPNFPAIKDHVLRGFGWDIDSGYSKPRGRLPVGSFGHTGFTGTSLWLDPASDTYVLLLTNAIHPHAGAAISNLRGEVATAAARALHLGDLQGIEDISSTTAASPRPPGPELADGEGLCSSAQNLTKAVQVAVHDPCHAAVPAQGASLLPERQAPYPQPQATHAHWLQAAYHPAQTPRPAATPHTLTGIDVLESTNFDPLLQMVTAKGHPIEIALLTNQTGVDREGHRTIDLLNNTALREKGVELSALFSPEHGIFGQQDTTHIRPESDTALGLPVTSLYGPRDSDRRPSHEQLKGLDAVLIDLQDAGVRFYTYETVLGYFLEAAAKEKSTYNHDLKIVVLDRPNPLGGLAVQGPISDPGAESYTDYMPLPVRHGLTLGELARYMAATNKLNVGLTVIAMQNWHRSAWYDDTGLPWINPSPNLRSLTAAALYPGLALLEMTNLSVGRGTATPFEVFGAGTPTTTTPVSSTTNEANTNPGAPSSRPQGVRMGPTTADPTSKVTTWFHAAEVAAALNARNIPGVRFEATHTTVADDGNRCPFHGQTIEAVHVLLTDRNVLDSPELGLEILAALHRLYPTQFQLAKAARLLANEDSMDALNDGEDPRDIAADYQAALDRFKEARQPTLLYH